MQLGIYFIEKDKNKVRLRIYSIEQPKMRYGVEVLLEVIKKISACFLPAN